MSLQYLYDFESQSVPGDDDDEILQTYWHSDGAVLTASLDGKLRAWHATTGRLLGTARKDVHTVAINSLTASPEQNLVLTTSMDGVLALWSTEALRGAVAASVEEDEPTLRPSDRLDWPLTLIATVALQGTNRKNSQGRSTALSNGEEGKLKIPTKRVFTPFRTALHPREPVFASVGAGASTFLHHCNPNEPETFGDLIKTLPNANKPSSSKNSEVDFGITVAFDPDGDLIATGTQQGSVQIHDFHTKAQIATIKDHSMCIRTLAFTRSRRLLTGCDDGLVTLYDVVDDEFDVTEGSKSSAGDGQEEICDSQYTTLSSTSTIQGNILTRRRVAYVTNWQAHNGYITSTQISSDGRVAVTSSMDGTLKIWDLYSGLQVKTPLCTLTQESEIWATCWIANRPQGDVPVSSSMMTAAAASVQHATSFVVVGGDTTVRWYRAAGTAL